MIDPFFVTIYFFTENLQKQTRKELKDFVRKDIIEIKIRILTQHNKKENNPTSQTRILGL